MLKINKDYVSVEMSNDTIEKIFSLGEFEVKDNKKSIDIIDGLIRIIAAISNYNEWYCLDPKNSKSKDIKNILNVFDNNIDKEIVESSNSCVKYTWCLSEYAINEVLSKNDRIELIKAADTEINNVTSTTNVSLKNCNYEIKCGKNNMYSIFLIINKDNRNDLVGFVICKLHK